MIKRKSDQQILKFLWESTLVILLVLSGFYVNAQTAGVPVEIIRANTMNLKKSDSTDIIILEGDVVLKQGKTIFKCNRCVKNDRANTFEAWGKVHINDSDTTNIYSDHLRYLTDKQMAYLNGNVRLTDGVVTLTAPNAEYNMTTNIATYKNGGKVVNKKTVITSKAANYYTDIKDVIFMRDVKVNDPAYNIVADSLLYNTENQIARFITYTVIRDSANRKITTREGYYNLRTGDAEFARRSMVNDNNKTTVIADSLTLTEEFAQAKGQAVVVDSVRGTIIIADLIYQNRITEAVLATRKPLMIIKQNKDSIYVTADTLFSAKLTDLYEHNDIIKGDSVINGKKTDSLSLTDSLGKSISPPKAIAHEKSFVIKDSLRASDSLHAPSIAASPPSGEVNLQKDIAGVAGADSSRNKLAVPPAMVQAPPAPSQRRNINRSGSPAISDTTQPSTAANNVKLQKKPNDNDSTNRYFEAFHNVRIFADSVQAVSDSLFYSFKDSVFRLYKDPVVWNEGNQITGDTLFLHTQNKKPKWFEAIGNGFMLSHIEKEAFNQLRSSRIDGFFTNGEMDSVKAKGSVQAVYYLQDDDSAYTGINQVKRADIINAYMQEKKLKKIVLLGQPQGTIFPIKQKSPKEMQLQGFNWREAERPKSKYDLFD